MVLGVLIAKTLETAGIKASRKLKESKLLFVGPDDDGNPLSGRCPWGKGRMEIVLNQQLLAVLNMARFWD